MITSAIPKDNTVYVYDKANVLFTKPGELHGYTCSTVSIKKDDIIYTYNEKNKLINSIPSK